MKYFMMGLHRALDFSGRSRRIELGGFILATFIISLGLYFLESLMGIMGFFSWILTLIVCLPSIALSVRRLHDVGHTGLLVLLYLLPVINLLLFAYLLFKEGDAGSNKYGPNPKGA